MARFTYARFSEAAREHITATAVWAYADNTPATPEHLRRALQSTPPAPLWERWRAAPAATSSQFTPELRAVLEQAFAAAQNSVEPADLAAALDAREP